MKLLLITTDITIFGGIERVINILTNSWIENENFNYDIEIISLYKNNLNNHQTSFKFNEKIKLTFLEKTLFVKHPKNKLDSFFILLKRYKELSDNLLSILKSSEADIIMTFHPDISSVVAMNYSKFKGKLIITEHGEPNYGCDKILKFLRKKFYKNADKIIVLTQESKKFYDKISQRVCVIPNPISFKNNIQTDYNSKNIICIGRLAPAKGIDQMIDIFNLITDAHPDWKLNIYGDGEDRDLIKEKISNYNLNERITLNPFIRNVEDIMLEHSIIAIPSRSEAFSMVLLEARECGLASISFDTMGPKEIINNKIDGELIKSNDVSEFSHRLSHIMSDKNLRQKYGINGKKTVQKYHVDYICEQWNKVFENLS